MSQRYTYFSGLLATLLASGACGSSKESFVDTLALDEFTSLPTLSTLDSDATVTVLQDKFLREISGCA